MKIIDLVKNKTAKFVCYRDGDLWYSIDMGEGTWEFPVPISDTGTGVFTCELKCIFLMRWIRKYMANLEKWREENKIKA